MSDVEVRVCAWIRLWRAVRRVQRLGGWFWSGSFWTAATTGRLHDAEASMKMINRVGVRMVRFTRGLLLKDRQISLGHLQNNESHGCPITWTDGGVSP